MNSNGIQSEHCEIKENGQVEDSGVKIWRLVLTGNIKTNSNIFELKCCRKVVHVVVRQQLRTGWQHSLSLWDGEYSGSQKLLPFF